MKIDRLLGIIIILLQRNKVTAPELAKKFEVSRRTILRDIEDICKAGIPIITYQGADGGISIAEGYKLDKNVLTAEELQSIITGLKSLGTVTDTSGIERLIQKLSPQNEAIISVKDSILIDLASHYKSSLSEKINLIKSAIEDYKVICFDYYAEKGISHRTIEPYFITFKWTAWYVFGYCLDRKEYRLFKLNRLWDLTMPNMFFTPRAIPEQETELDNYFTDENRVTIVFDESVEYRLVEEYGPESYKKREDGTLEFSIGYTNKEYIISWILGFGDKAIVMDPIDLINEIRQKIKNISQNYGT